METEIQVYNVDTMGPVVSLHSIKWLLQDLVTRGIGGVALERTLRMVERVRDEASLERPVRLGPSVPGGSVQPTIARISCIR